MVTRHWEAGGERENGKGRGREEIRVMEDKKSKE